MKISFLFSLYKLNKRIRHIYDFLMLYRKKAKHLSDNLQYEAKINSVLNNNLFFLLTYYYYVNKTVGDHLILVLKCGKR